MKRSKAIADRCRNDQQVIIAGRVGVHNSDGEHQTIYGRPKEHCDVSARIGDPQQNYPRVRASALCAHGLTQ